MAKKDSLKPERVKWHLQQGFVISPTYSLSQTFVDSDEFVHKFDENPGKFTLFALKQDEHGHLDVADRFFVEVLPTDTRIIFIEPAGHLDLQLGKPLKLRLQVINPENLKNVLVSLELKKDRYNVIEFSESALSPTMPVVNLEAEITYDKLEAIMGKDLLNKRLKFDLFVRGFDHDNKLLTEGRQTVTFFSDILGPKDLEKEYKCNSGVLRAKIVEPEKGVMKETGKNIWWAMDKCMDEKYLKEGKRCCRLTSNLVLGVAIHLADSNEFIPGGDETGRTVIVNLNESDKKENWLMFLSEQFDKYIKSILPVEEAKVVIKFKVPKAEIYTHKSTEEIPFVVGIEAPSEIKHLISSLDVRIHSEMDDEFSDTGFVLDVDNTKDEVMFDINEDMVKSFKPNYNYNVVCKIIDIGAKDISNVINKTVKRESKDEEIEVKIIKPKGVVETTKTENISVSYGYKNNTGRPGEITIYATPLEDDETVSKKGNIIIETRKVKQFSHKVEDTKIIIGNANYKRYRIFVSLVLRGHIFLGQTETSDHFDVILTDIIESKMEVGLRLLKDISDLHKLEAEFNSKLIKGEELLAEEITEHQSLVSRNELIEKEVTTIPATLFNVKYHCWNFSGNDYELVITRQKFNQKGKVIGSFEIDRKVLGKGTLLTEEFPVPVHMLEPSNYKFVILLEEKKTFGAKKLSDSILLHLLPGEEEEKPSTELGEFEFLNRELAVLEFVSPVKNNGEFSLGDKIPEVKFTLNFRDKEKRDKLNLLLTIENLGEVVEGRGPLIDVIDKYVLPFELKYKKDGNYNLGISPGAFQFMKPGYKYKFSLVLVDFVERGDMSPVFESLQGYWDQEQGEIIGAQIPKLKFWVRSKGKRMISASNYAIINIVREGERDQEDILKLVNQIAPEIKTERIKFISPEGGGLHHVFESLEPVTLKLEVYDPSNQAARISCYIKSDKDKQFTKFVHVGDFLKRFPDLYEFYITQDLLLKLQLNTTYEFTAQVFKILDNKFVYGSKDSVSISFGPKLETPELYPYKYPEEVSEEPSEELAITEEPSEGEEIYEETLKEIPISYGEKKAKIKLTDNIPMNIRLMVAIERLQRQGLFANLLIQYPDLEEINIELE